MIHHPVTQSIGRVREKLRLANEQAQTADSTPLHDAFGTLRLAVDDLADAVEDLYAAAALEEQGQ